MIAGQTIGIGLGLIYWLSSRSKLFMQSPICLRKQRQTPNIVKKIRGKRTPKTIFKVLSSILYEKIHKLKNNYRKPPGGPVIPIFE